MFKGFRDFILRGNVMDLAVAFIMGAAFNAIVTSLVKDVLMQVIAAIVGKPDFSAIKIYLLGTPIMIGNFLNATVSFLIVAFVIFLVVQQVNRWNKPAPAAAPTTKDCTYCQTAIPIKATRCPNCTSELRTA